MLDGDGDADEIGEAEGVDENDLTGEIRSKETMVDAISVVHKLDQERSKQYLQEWTMCVSRNGPRGSILFSNSHSMKTNQFTDESMA